VDFPNNGRRIVRTLGGFFECLELFGRVDALGVRAFQAQRPFDCNFPVAEGFVWKDL